MNKRRQRKRANRKKIILLLVVLAAVFLFTACDSLSSAAESGDAVAGLLSNRSESVNILLLLTILSLLPSILIMLTCFTRIVIVLSLVRNGMGVQQMPPNQVLIGLALFLTFFVMSPVITEVKEVAYEPYIAEEIDAGEAIERGMQPIRTYMIKQTYQEDLAFFTNVSQAHAEEPLVIESYDDIPTSALIPAYITSEIKQGFKIGFYIYIPFIVIDMIVASTLMAMGMMMLPPVVISLPFKILLFVLVDGWMLTIKTLLSSFR